MNKISLVINSKNPNQEWLKECLHSAVSFDEIILYIDGEVPVIDSLSIKEKEYLKVIGDGQSRSIPQGFNYAVRSSTGNWICAFCDDDYFHTENLQELITLIKSGFCNLADVVHFQASLINGGLWGANEVTYDKLIYNNILPFSSFFTREIFEKVGGFNEKVGAYNDWNFWLRIAKADGRFKYFDKPVYCFRQGHESATNKLLSEIGGHCAAIREVLDNA